MKSSQFNEAYQFICNQGFNMSGIKEKPYHSEDGGIPPDMVDEVMEEGWGTWKTVASKLSRQDVESFIDKNCSTTSEDLIEYLLSDCHMIEELPFDNQTNVFIPHIPSDDPLGPMQSLINGWIPLADLGYLPIAVMGDGWGPICIKQNGEVIWFDHEALVELLDNPNIEELKKVEQQVSNSASKFYETIFG